MLWAFMIIAMIVSVLVELACFFIFKIKNFALVLTLQFLASLGTTYALAYRFAGSLEQEGMNNILLTCAAVSFAIVVLFAVIRHYLGSWHTRKPGPGMKA
jgi:peptidoglycan biosynthesis protein MviN/MurJ (putative lipid II flippase)